MFSSLKKFLFIFSLVDILVPHPSWVSHISIKEIWVFKSFIHRNLLNQLLLSSFEQKTEI
jgi:hypothetical protein